MASKKDFSGMNTTAAAGAKVRSTIESGTGKRGQQASATPEEQADFYYKMTGKRLSRR